MRFIEAKFLTVLNVLALSSCSMLDVRKSCPQTYHEIGGLNAQANAANEKVARIVEFSPELSAHLIGQVNESTHGKDIVDDVCWYAFSDRDELLMFERSELNRPFIVSKYFYVRKGNDWELDRFEITTR